MRLEGKSPASGVFSEGLKPNICEPLNGQLKLPLFCCRLLLNSVREFFDHWVGKHLFGDALHLGLGSGFVELAVEGDLKELALADAANALVTHFLERAVNGLALRIKDGGLEHDGNVGLHVGSIIN